MILRNLIHVGRVDLTSLRVLWNHQHQPFDLPMNLIEGYNKCLHVNICCDWSPSPSAVMYECTMHICMYITIDSRHTEHT